VKEIKEYIHDTKSKTDFYKIQERIYVNDNRFEQRSILEKIAIGNLLCNMMREMHKNIKKTG
jgi:hypothetical protein